MLEKNTFKVIDDKGREVICDVLLTFESEETHKNYILYTDNSKDANGQTNVFASIFDPNDENTKLEEIKTEKEWKIIETILNTVQEEIKSQIGKKDKENQD